MSLGDLLDTLNENPDIIHERQEQDYTPFDRNPFVDKPCGFERVHPVGILCRDTATAEQTQRLFDIKIARCFAPRFAVFGFRLSGLMVYAGFDPDAPKNRDWWMQLQTRVVRNGRIVYQ